MVKDGDKYIFQKNSNEWEKGDVIRVTVKPNGRLKLYNETKFLSGNSDYDPANLANRIDWIPMGAVCSECDEPALENDFLCAEHRGSTPLSGRFVATINDKATIIPFMYEHNALTLQVSVPDLTICLEADDIPKSFILALNKFAADSGF